MRWRSDADVYGPLRIEEEMRFRCPWPSRRCSCLLSGAKKPTLAGMSTFARVILILLAIDAVLSVAVAVLMLSGYFC